ncbi:MAG: RagB/SusD family nutrient uptake outer membrane protein [Bacteroidales bacterium]|nr:RagB/SusD family nutrient uptake outer membrane protein [Bacteroidales bacterium]
MKKNIFALLAIALLGIFSTSCEKVLEKTPDGQITIDQVLSNYARSQGLIDETYGQVYLIRDGIAFVYCTIDALTDNAYTAIPYNAYDWHNGSLSLSNPVINDLWASPTDQLWPDFWRGIRFANNAIKYLPQSTAITDLQKSQWVAEARVLRCWFYMNLMEFYGPVPWFDEPIDPNFEGWNSLVRPTYDELADKIAAELDDVINSGDLAQQSTPTDARHVDCGVARAIKARVYLNNASVLNNPNHDDALWQKALNAALDVTAMSQYSLVPMSDYKSLFCSDFANRPSEIIWRSWYNNSEINNKNAVNVQPYGSGIPAMWNCGESPTQELVDCFEMTNGALPVTYDDDTHLHVTVTPEAAALGYSEGKNGDPYANRDARFYNNIVYNGCNYGVPYNCTEPYIIETFVGGKNGFNDVIAKETQNSCTGYYNRKDSQIKFWGANGNNGNCLGTYWVYFRLAEFYLNAAEAYCELGKYSEACQMLNMTRERAGQPAIEDVPGYAASYEFLMPRIRNERRVEFCMEGWRFHDQRRWKILSETNRFVTGMRITKDDDGNLSYERRKIRDYQSYTDKYLIMPIPLEDAKKMVNLEQPEAWR